jgi:anti-sigma factor RsiW
VTCREIAKFLMDYVAGDLPVDERRRFEAHFAECPDCVAYLDSYRATIRLGRSLADVPPAGMPEELVHAILAARLQSNRGG